MKVMVEVIDGKQISIADVCKKFNLTKLTSDEIVNKLNVVIEDDCNSFTTNNFKICTEKPYISLKNVTENLTFNFLVFLTIPDFLY